MGRALDRQARAAFLETPSQTIMKRIHDSLNLCFHRRRLVFWYDASGEWKKAFEGFEESAVATIPGLAKNEDG